MSKIKIMFLVLSFLLVGLCLTGCDTYNELNNILIVDSIGVDKKDDEYIITFNTYDKDNKYKKYTLKEKNYYDSFADIELEINRKIYLSHLNLLVLSNSLSQNEIKDIFNLLNDQNDLRLSFKVIFLKNYEEAFFDNASLDIVNLLNNNYHNNGAIYPITFNEITKNYLEGKISNVPIIDINKKIIGSMTIFKEPTFLDVNASKYLNLLLKNNKKIVFNIEKEEVNLNNIIVKYVVDKNQLKFEIMGEYASQLEEETVTNYLKEQLDHLLENEVNSSYFWPIIKKYDYPYYKDNYDKVVLHYEVAINLKNNNSNNMKDGELFAKN